MQNVEFQDAILDNPDLADVIFYRTPHQAKSSSIPARIVGFTTNGVYGQVIFNPFVLKQAGPDFDIDKTTLLTKDIKFDKKTKQFSLVENSRLTIMYNLVDSAMTDMSQLEEMLIPNNTETLDSLVNKESGLPNTLSFLLMLKNKNNKGLGLR